MEEVGVELRPGCGPQRPRNTSKEQCRDTGWGTDSDSPSQLPVSRNSFATPL